LSIQQTIRIVRAVQAVQEAKARIFVSTPKTFFSVNDIWQYVEISDDKLCANCVFNAAWNDGIYSGDELRRKFPYLEILDEDTIRVEEHPNCRCVLTRMFPKIGG